jgi:hypothetical protein
MPLLIWPALHITMIFVIIAAVVAFLFQQQKRISATVFLFAGYCVVLLASYVYFFNPLDYNNPSRSFSTQVGKLVPASDELVAYNYVTARTIQYAGRTIPEIYDINEIRSRYDNGAWIIATSDDYQDMLKAGGFDIVFYRQMAERAGSEHTEGALFHKVRY